MINRRVDSLHASERPNAARARARRLIQEVRDGESPKGCGGGRTFRYAEFHSEANRVSPLATCVVGLSKESRRLGQRAGTFISLELRAEVAPRVGIVLKYLHFHILRGSVRP